MLSITKDAPLRPTQAHEEPRGFHSDLAARWGYVLRRMGVNADPDDEPKLYNILPDFGSGSGEAAYYCGPYQQGSWPNHLVVAACALVAASQCRNAFLLGNIGHGSAPQITAIGPSQGAYAWCRTPLMATSGLRLAWIPARWRRHVAAVVTSEGVFARIGRPVGADFAPDLPRTEAGVVRLIREAASLRVALSATAQPPAAADGAALAG